MREFIGLLNSRRVEYVIVGAHAVAFHGYPRFTGDVDFLIRPTPENAARVVDVLDVFGFGELGLKVSTFTEPDKVVQLEHRTVWSADGSWGCVVRMRLRARRRTARRPFEEGRGRRRAAKRREARRCNLFGALGGVPGFLPSIPKSSKSL
ncbi:MAG: hypothetical protein ACOCV4_09340, partial [Myxococcota bacterium]